MKKQILLLLLVATSVIGQLRAQNTGAATLSTRDSVVYKASFYFPRDIGNLIQPLDYITSGRLVRWAKSNPAIPIEITGWADKSGTKEQNERISLRRARTLNNYLIRKGIAKERITFEGAGVDTHAESYDKARRTDVSGVIRLAMASEPQAEIQFEPKETAPVLALQTTTPAQSKQEDKQPATQEPQSTTQPKVIISQTSPICSTSTTNLRWYAGIEGGVSFGVSTLSSFATKGGIGWNVGILGGYRISPLLSTEVGISFGGLKLGASECCEDYFLGADGNRYLGSVAGMDSYSYKNIYSSVSMQQYALRLNVDMLQIVNADWDKRWSLNVSPAIYGVNTSATLKTDNTTIIKRNSQFQFGAGAGIGVGYQINRNLGLSIRSGATWVFGERFDGITPNDHQDNMIWNNNVSLIWRFGCNK